MFGNNKKQEVTNEIDSVKRDDISIFKKNEKDFFFYWKIYEI